MGGKDQSDGAAMKFLKGLFALIAVGIRVAFPSPSSGDGATAAIVAVNGLIIASQAWNKGGFGVNVGFIDNQAANGGSPSSTPRKG